MLPGPVALVDDDGDAKSTARTRYLRPDTHPNFCYRIPFIGDYMRLNCTDFNPDNADLRLNGELGAYKGVPPSAARNNVVWRFSALRFSVLATVILFGLGMCMSLYMGENVHGMSLLFARTCMAYKARMGTALLDMYPLAY